MRHHRISLSPLSLLAALMIGVVITSCSKRGELLDSVPADVKMVATVNVEKLCEDAGIKFTPDGGIEVVPQLQSHMSDDMRNLPARLSKLKASGAVDLTDAVMGVDAANETFITLAINDSKALREATAGYLTWSDDASGYSVAQEDNTSFVANDTQMWIMGGSTGYVVKQVEEMLKGAKELAVSKLDGIAQVMARDNLINVAVPSGSFLFLPSGNDNAEVAPQEQTWSVLSLNVGADNALVAEAEMMKATGVTIVP
ncbi:MAG: hypothetical protein K2K77_09245, partial [Duncaniella sp.]|nr:hypothetical protein [Duncaniella sp.]